MVTINQLADMIAAVAGISITKKHIDGPQGVRGRNSDNTRLRKVLGWEPRISLEEASAGPTAGSRSRSEMRMLQRTPAPVRRAPFEQYGGTNRISRLSTRCCFLADAGSAQKTSP